MPRINVVALSLLVAALAMCQTGCDREPELHSISGEVRSQGVPVAQGEIVFADAAGAAASTSARIEAGRYACETTAGDKIIRITATKETGKIVEGAMGAKYPEVVDLIPPRYNTASELRQRVEPRDGQVIDFQLEP